MESTFEEIVNQLREHYQNIKSFSTCKQKLDKIVGSSGDDNAKNEKHLEDQFSLIETKLEAILSRIIVDSPDYCKILSIIASILYEKAKVCLDNNLLSASKSYLEKSLNIMQSYSDNPQITFIYLRVVNYLSYVRSRMGDFETAKALLEEVVNNELKCEPLIYSTNDLFLSNKSDDALGKLKLQKLKINNMLMLSWVYGKLGMMNLYAETLHRSLQKEIDINDGDAVHWAMRCYSLASLFMVQDKWENARYHLTAAQAVLDPLEVALVPNVTLFKAQADLAKVWVSYGIQLFGMSKRSVLERIWAENDEIQRNDKLFDPNAFKFSSMPIIVPNIPIKEITNIQEARELFTHTHRWLKRARLFYTLRDYPLQYVDIILELSELYRYLAYYEKDLDSQYDVHKKRFETLEMLSSVMREIRPSCYATVSIEIVREIADVQLEMMNINLKRIFNPSENVNMTENYLRKRIDTVNIINTKIGKLCSKEEDVKSCLVRDVEDLTAVASDNIIDKTKNEEPKHLMQEPIEEFNRLDNCDRKEVELEEKRDNVSDE